MRTVLVLLCLFLLSFPATSVAGQQTAHPKHQRAPKPKRHEPTVVIVQPIDTTTEIDSESQMRKLYARAGLLKVFSTDKKYDDVPPAEMQGGVDQLGIDFTTTTNWTADNFGKLAKALEGDYVAGVELISLNVGPPANAKPAKNAKNGPSLLDASIDIACWLYDAKTQKMLLSGDKLHWNYIAHRGDDKLDSRDVGYEVILQAVEHAYKDVPKARR